MTKSITYERLRLILQIELGNKRASELMKIITRTVDAAEEVVDYLREEEPPIRYVAGEKDPVWFGKPEHVIDCSEHEEPFDPGPEWWDFVSTSKSSWWGLLKKWREMFP